MTTTEKVAPQRMRLQLERRECPACGLELKRKDGECASDWGRRIYCDLTCRNVGLRRPRPVVDPAPAEEESPAWEEQARCRGSRASFWAASNDPVEEQRLRALAFELCARCPLAARRQCRIRGAQVQEGLFDGVLYRKSARIGLERIDLFAPVEAAS